MFSIFKKLHQKLPKPIRITVRFVIAILFVLTVCIIISVIENRIGYGNQMRHKNAVGQNSMVDIGLRNEENPLQEYAQSKVSVNYQFEFLNVGQADCAIITNSNSTMMIDTGNAEDAKYILKHLDDKGINKINYLVCTNESEEHIGGLLDILTYIQVENLIIPNINTENELMKSCVKCAVSRCAAVREAYPFDAWNLDEAQCIVLQNKNNMILKVSMHGVSVLFLSDASHEEELSLLDLEMDISANIIKTSGHGAPNTANDKLLQEVDAEYAVVSCDESTTKPDIKTMNRLYKRSTVYRTDRHDTIVVTTDGVYYELRTKEIDCNG